METVEQDLVEAYPMFILEGAGHVPVVDAPGLGSMVSGINADESPSQLLNIIIVEAYRLGVTAINIESVEGERSAHVWFGMDDVMLDYLLVPASLREGLVAHVKMMCGLQESVHDIPQISRIDFHEVGTEKIELRVVTLPSAGGGEDIRLRMLRAPLELAA